MVGLVPSANMNSMPWSASSSDRNISPIDRASLVRATSTWNIRTFPPSAGRIASGSSGCWGSACAWITALGHCRAATAG